MPSFSHNPQLAPDLDEITRAVKLFYDEPGDVFELRIPKAQHKRTISGYFNAPDLLVREAMRLDGAGPATYITLNPCQPALLARASNHVVMDATLTTSDRDILLYRRLLLDFD